MKHVSSSKQRRKQKVSKRESSEELTQLSLLCILSRLLVLMEVSGDERMSLRDDRSDSSCVFSGDVVLFREIDDDFSESARGEIESTASVDSQHGERSGRSTYPEN